jgi:hypothetical protein
MLWIQVAGKICSTESEANPYYTACQIGTALQNGWFDLIIVAGEPAKFRIIDYHEGLSIH